VEAAPAPDARLGEALRERGALSALRGGREAAERDYVRALSLAEAGGDAALAADVLRHLGRLRYDQGRREEGLADYARALSLARAAGARALEGVIRMLLGSLALDGRRLADPGLALPGGALIEAGWPGSRAGSASAQNRMHVAISTLRKLGLDALLRSTPEGYLLDPAVPLAVV
jgi:tetratricopeptide (TPR) repeat protein